MELTDKEIVAQLKQTETKEKAFRYLLATYQERLYFHVRRYVHNHEDANDILQNTFIKVWNFIEQFREDASLFTWLYRIASNEAITYINKQKKRNEVDIEHTSIAQNGVTDNLTSGELEQKLQQAIDLLPDKQKQVFIMRYFDELPYDEIAAIVDTSVGALKASYHHAVKKIETFLTA